MPKNNLTYTLTTDGTSDTAFLPILDWLIQTTGFRGVINSQWADPLDLRLRQPHDLPRKLQKALALYPCDILFVHRDAETEPRTKRLDEITQAMLTLSTPPPYVCVVPVRMQEAWLLIDEQAIRRAAGNRHGRQPLALPPLSHLEQEPNPKQVLYDLLRTASGLTTRRRLKQFERDLTHIAKLVSEQINDFSPLRSLAAFAALEQELGSVLQDGGWL